MSLLVERYELEIRVETGRYGLEGSARMHLRNLGSGEVRSIDLYLHPELQIGEVRCRGTETPFVCELLLSGMSTTGTLRGARCQLPEPLAPDAETTLEVSYRGWIHPSTARGSRSDGYIGIGKETVFLRGYGYTAWFPWISFDRDGYQEKADFSVSVEVPDRWRTVAFGELRSEMTGGGRYRSSWRTAGRVPLNLAGIWAGCWTRAGDDDLTVYHLGSEESREAARILTEVALPLRRAMIEQYGQGGRRTRYFLVELDLPSGGYPIQGAVGLAKEGFRRAIDPDARYGIFEWLGHEMVHEFVDVAPDVKAPGAAAIHDGFALYFHLPLLGELLGPEFEVRDLEKRWGRYRRGREGGSDAEGRLPPEKPISAISLKEYGAYKDRFLISDKLQIVLTQLRRTVGHGAFMRGTAGFLAAHRTQPATIADFRKAIEREAGMDLVEFFHRWLDTTEELPSEWRYWEGKGERAGGLRGGCEE